MDLARIERESEALEDRLVASNGVEVIDLEHQEYGTNRANDEPIESIAPNKDPKHQKNINQK